MTTNTFRRVAYLTLALSVFGMVLISSLMLGPAETLKITTTECVSIGVGYLAMIGAVEFIGIRFRSSLVRWPMGAIFGYFTFVVGTFFGAASKMIGHGGFDVYSYFIKPFIWLSFFGYLPATIIGIVGSIHLGRRATSANPKDRFER